MKSVKIRYKLIKDNKSRIYLQYYPSYYNPLTKKSSRYETTSFWIYNDFKSETVYYEDQNGKKQSKIEVLKDRSGKPKKIILSAIQKRHNQENVLSAEILQGKRLKEITKPDLYSSSELRNMQLHENRVASFTEYFNKKSENTKVSVGAWQASYKYFERFFGDVQFKDINQTLIEDFKNKLIGAKRLRGKNLTIKKNSSASYFIRFGQVLEMAFDENYLEQNFKNKIKWIEEEETEKSFLTLNECKKLFKTDFEDQLLVKISKFAFLTGLRFSDISNLKWGDVEKRNDVYFINFRIKKTSTLQWHPISNEAFELMGTQRENDENVFPGIVYHSLNKKLRKWISNVKIKIQLLLSSHFGIPTSNIQKKNLKGVSGGYFVWGFDF